MSPKKLPKKAAATAAKKKHIEYSLRRCALEIHHKGELQRLASEMGLTPRVFSYWVAKGRIPRSKATWLENRFGKDVADASTLTA